MKEEDTPTPLILRRKWYQHPITVIICSLIVFAQLALSISLFITIFVVHHHLIYVCQGAEFTIFVVLLVIALVGIIVSIYSIVKNAVMGCIVQRISKASNIGELPSKIQQIADTTTVNQQRPFTLAEKFLVVFKAIVIILSIIATIAIVIVAIVFLSLSQPSLPNLKGTVRLSDSQLSAPVTIERESSGIIHVTGNTKHDVVFAQGYVTAQERLWQLEFNRRVARGTLSEVVGSPAVTVDKFARTMGFAKLVDADLESGIFSNDTLALIQRYMDGVNAYVESSANSKLAPEFSLFDYRPEPFVIQDTLLWVKLLSYTLSTNLDFELERFLQLRNGVSFERVQELLPPYSSSRITILSKQELNIQTGTLDDELMELAFNNNTAAFIPSFNGTSNSRRIHDEERFSFSKEYGNLYSQIFKTTYRSPFASNNWVVSGNLTRNGKGMCANDPHLSITAPSIWLMIHLKTTQEESNWDGFGVALPGVPAIVLGKNQDICWGATNSMPDVQDLYVINESGDQYWYNGTLRDYEVVDELIRVKDGKDIALKVKKTVHGPIINDVWSEKLGSEYPVALKWTSLMPEDRTAQVVINFINHKNWTEFRNSFIDGYRSPTQNFVYGDKDGNIGYIAPGYVPIRKEGHSGMYPVSGEGEWEWQGTIPFDELPQVYNPPKGYIVTANNRVQPVGYKYGYARDFATSYRAQRITDLIEGFIARGNITVQDMKLTQLDTKSLYFEEMKPGFLILQDYFTTTRETKQRDWATKLYAWNGDEKTGSQEATLWESFLRELPKLFSRELGYDTYANSDYLTVFVANATGTNLTSVATTFKRALRVVDKVNTGSLLLWGDDVHHLEAKHEILDSTGLKCLASRRVLVPGGTDTVAVAAPSLGNFGFSFGPSYRGIMNFDRLDSIILPTGQSGNWFSYYYDNLMSVYSKGQYLPMLHSGYTVKNKLTIQP